MTRISHDGEGGRDDPMCFGGKEQLNFQDVPASVKSVVTSCMGRDES